jgi:hypothetical protein
MNVWIDGWLMESNGSHGTCTQDKGAISQDSDYWNDWWVIDGPIAEDTSYRQEWGYLRGFDYAGGRPGGAALREAGASFVARYLADGGTQLPQKRMTPEEANDLRANGIRIVSNWESYANRMREGYQAGLADAHAAQDWHRHSGGPDDAVIYFSCDYDEPECDQPGVNDYLRACCDVLGGPDRVGIYGAYYVCKRALDAGVAHFMWQTEAWSGGNIDSRVNIMQRNHMGYEHPGGVEADIDEAHTDYFGQWGADVAPAPIANPPGTPGGPAVAPSPQTLTDRQLMEDIWIQLHKLRPGDPIPDIEALEALRLSKKATAKKATVKKATSRKKAAATKAAPRRRSRTTAKSAAKKA